MLTTIPIITATDAPDYGAYAPIMAHSHGVTADNLPRYHYNLRSFSLFALRNRLCALFWPPCRGCWIT